MKPRDRIKTLNDLKAICAVRRMDAEMQVERANTYLRRLDGARCSEDRTLQAAHDGWRQAVSGRTFELVSSAFWSAEILRSQAAIDRLTDEITTAKEARQDLYKTQNAATARCDAVDNLRHCAVRDDQRRRDEAAMEAYGGRGFASWRST